jgi:hypothetical protein
LEFYLDNIREKTRICFEDQLSNLCYKKLLSIILRKSLKNTHKKTVKEVPGKLEACIYFFMNTGEIKNVRRKEKNLHPEKVGGSLVSLIGGKRLILR